VPDTRSKFEPWRENLRRKAAYTLGAAAFGANLIYPFIASGAAVSAGLCATLGLLALYEHRKAKARQFGQRVEAVHGELARAALETAGYRVELGKRLRTGGDADLIIGQGLRSAVVEIKSYHFWNARRQDKPRESKAIEQVLRQQEVLNADSALIWLPVANPSLWQLIWGYSFGGRGVAIVRGSKHHLRRALRRKFG